MLTQALKEMGYHQQASVSIGIAMHPYDGISYETLYNNADKALYYVMKSGECNYCFYSDEAMNALEISVVASLRMVDVGTRYSSVQYMVILLDSDVTNGKKVAERVIKKFYKSYLVGDGDISYDIQTMQTKSEE